jgi:hypothetical protein
MGVSFILFLLYELPAMIIIAIHRAIVESRGESYAMRQLNIWAYRAIGVFTVWPVVLIILFVIVKLNS